MAKYSKNKASDKTKEEAMKIARGTQRPGQTKEQTKLIAQGIQKGIEQYKKQQSRKKRELNKKLNKADAMLEQGKDSSSPVESIIVVRQQRLPWFLLIFSWSAFLTYLLLF